jgi:hypothetical protein
MRTDAIRCERITQTQHDPQRAQRRVHVTRNSEYWCILIRLKLMIRTGGNRAITDAKKITLLKT